MNSGAGIMISAAGSGAGKTLLTCGLLSVFQKKGIRVGACKCGPDYIDTMFHKQVLGVPSINLDSFFLGEETLRYIYGRHAQKSELTVIEGVMGYYDGIGGASVRASAYETASVLQVPVLLVVDCLKVSTSVVPIIQGFLNYQKDSNIKGILFNYLSKDRYPAMKELVEKETGCQVYGYVPRLSECILESRHLGLVTPTEIESIEGKLRKLSEVLAQTVDLDGLIRLANLAGENKTQHTIPVRKQYPVKIGVAKDEAFCFFYEDNLELLRELGAELVYFSPLEDTCLPEGIAGLLLSGGYPELYAARLGANQSMLASVRQHIQAGMPTIAECGGFLYLHQNMVFLDGTVCGLAGVLPFSARETKKLQRFGYITLQAQKDTMLLQKGDTIRAHEFHYYTSDHDGESFLARKAAGNQEWQCIHGDESLYAGFPHLYFYQKPEMAELFLKKCADWKKNDESTEKSNEYITFSNYTGK